MSGATLTRGLLGVGILLAGIVLLLSWGLGFSLGGLIGLLVALAAIGGGIAVGAGGNYRGGVPAVAMAIVGYFLYPYETMDGYVSGALFGIVGLGMVALIAWHVE